MLINTRHRRLSFLVTNILINECCNDFCNGTFYDHLLQVFVNNKRTTFQWIWNISYISLCMESSWWTWLLYYWGWVSRQSLIFLPLLRNPCLLPFLFFLTLSVIYRFVGKNLGKFCFIIYYYYLTAKRSKTELSRMISTFVRCIMTWVAAADSFLSGVPNSHKCDTDLTSQIKNLLNLREFPFR